MDQGDQLCFSPLNSCFDSYGMCVSGCIFLFSALLQVCVVPANSSWVGVFIDLSEKDCRKEGENHVSGKRLLVAEWL
jgi:hypothetical protein